MKHSEIQMFMQFLSDKKISEVFAETYKKNHLMTNPPSLDDYLERIRAENVIPQAFSYPNNYFGLGGNRCSVENQQPGAS